MRFIFKHLFSSLKVLPSRCRFPGKARDALSQQQRSPRAKQSWHQRPTGAELVESVPSSSDREDLPGGPDLGQLSVRRWPVHSKTVTGEIFMEFSMERASLPWLGNELDLFVSAQGPFQRSSAFLSALGIGGEKCFLFLVSASSPS